MTSGWMRRFHFMSADDAMLTDHGPETLRTADGRYFNPALFRMDRIHLNKKGHDVWTAPDQLIPGIRPVYCVIKS